MKYLDITLGRDGATLIYPKNYQLEIGDPAKDHLYYDEGDIPKLLLLIPDKEYKKSMVRERVVEITEAQAKAISEAKEQRKEIVTDEAKIRRIHIKAVLGEGLTADEKKALDPTDTTPGFEMAKILADRIDIHKRNE